MYYSRHHFSLRKRKIRSRQLRYKITWKINFFFLCPIQEICTIKQIQKIRLTLSLTLKVHPFKLYCNMWFSMKQPYFWKERKKTTLTQSTNCYICLNFCWPNHWLLTYSRKLLELPWRLVWYTIQSIGIFTIYGLLQNTASWFHCLRLQYIYIYIYLCVCVCERERERERVPMDAVQSLLLFCVLFLFSSTIVDHVLMNWWTMLNILWII